jgi:PIN domain nuclease of toxin-antitoxin system
MRVLLDTHVFLWVALDSPRLSARAREVLDEAEAIFVSAASIWEITIRHALGHTSPDPRLVKTAIDGSGLLELPIAVEHALAVAQLPPHHRDPFDRILVAQAITEPLHLLSADALLPRYSELVISV